MKNFSPPLNDKSKNEIKQIKTQLLMEIEFGTPSSGCQNFGICNMIPLEEEFIIKATDKKGSKAMLTVFVFDRIEIDFFKHSMNLHNIAKFFGGESFTVEESYACHIKISEKEHLNFEIKNGHYPIIDCNTLLKVKFE